MGLVPVMVLSLAERARAALRVDPLGVRGVNEFEIEDAEDEGRAAGCRTGRGFVFKTLAGRGGEDLLLEGVGGLSLVDGVEGVSGGVVFTTDDAFSAARCGKGLIGREYFSLEKEFDPGFCCSFAPSSEEVLRRRRVPALVGVAGFVGSIA